MDPVWNLLVLPVGLELLGFIEPCSVGSSLLFVRFVEGKPEAGGSGCRVHRHACAVHRRVGRAGRDHRNGIPANRLGAAGQPLIGPGFYNFVHQLEVLVQDG